MTVQLTISDHVALITLASAEPGNLITPDAARDLRDAAIAARQDDDVWTVALAADGPDFCLGTDPDSLRAELEDRSTPDALRAALPIAEIEKPVVCALEGSAQDQGLELALACDLRICDSSASFAMTRALDGAMPWDGGTQRLPRLIGRSRAMELLLTGRRLSAPEALDYGLVNEVVESGGALPRAIELAKTIAAHGPIALRYIKEATLSGMDGSVAQGLRLEADLSFLLQSTADRAEGISSFLQRRSPSYRGE